MQSGSRASTGSIPASAGKPAASALRCLSTRVHPRERGEALRLLWRLPLGRGPSPRARGSRLTTRGRRGVSGSIPASAGKPPARGKGEGSATVHPRERGEADSTNLRAVLAGGPSPRARGSHIFTEGKDQACRVHPRERGEARIRAERPAWLRGPSPRARGSRALRRRHDGADGSIPASAGKPASKAHLSAQARVHPRERGETPVWLTAPPLGSGPSPRARGSLREAIRACQILRSIPASAGKPVRRPA